MAIVLCAEWMLRLNKRCVDTDLLKQRQQLAFSLRCEALGPAAKFVQTRMLQLRWVERGLQL